MNQEFEKEKLIPFPTSKNQQGKVNSVIEDLEPFSKNNLKSKTNNKQMLLNDQDIIIEFIEAIQNNFMDIQRVSQIFENQQVYIQEFFENHLYDYPYLLKKLFRNLQFILQANQDPQLKRYLKRFDLQNYFFSSNIEDLILYQESTFYPETIEIFVKIFQGLLHDRSSELLKHSQQICSNLQNFWQFMSAQEADTILKFLQEFLIKGNQATQKFCEQGIDLIITLLQKQSKIQDKVIVYLNLWKQCEINKDISIELQNKLKLETLDLTKRPISQPTQQFFQLFFQNSFLQKLNFQENYEIQKFVFQNLKKFELTNLEILNVYKDFLKLFKQYQKQKIEILCKKISKYYVLVYIDLFWNYENQKFRSIKFLQDLFVKILVSLNIITNDISFIIETFRYSFIRKNKQLLSILRTFQQQFYKNNKRLHKLHKPTFYKFTQNSFDKNVQKTYSKQQINIIAKSFLNKILQDENDFNKSENVLNKMKTIQILNLCEILQKVKTLNLSLEIIKCIYNKKISQKKPITENEFLLIRNLYKFQEKQALRKKFIYLSQQFQKDKPLFELILNRQDLITSIIKQKLLGKKVKISFENEKGFGNSLFREFLYYFSKQLKDSNILKKDNEHYLFQLELFENNIYRQNFFENLGIFFGYAYMKNFIFDIRLPQLFWKLVLDINITQQDLLNHDLHYSQFLFEQHKNYDFLQEDQKQDTISINTYKKQFLYDKFFKDLVQIVNYFKNGLFSIIPQKALQIYNIDEIQDLFEGSNKKYIVRDHLYKYVEAGYGYTKDCMIYKWTLDIILEFNENLQNLFLVFITGNKRLPQGGFKNFDPKFKISKKFTENLHELPSVMTCQNYLKMPEYRTKDDLRQKMILAITEGRQSFNLS